MVMRKHCDICNAVIDGGITVTLKTLESDIKLLHEINLQFGGGNPLMVCKFCLTDALNSEDMRDIERPAFLRKIMD